MHTNEWPARRCSGPCDQGRKLCPSPEACRVDTEGEGIAFGCFLVPAVVLALLLLAWLVATVLRAA